MDDHDFATVMTEALTHLDAETERPAPRAVRCGGDLWVVEGTGDYSGQTFHVVMIVELRDGKIARETRYYTDPFEPPEWRAQWVERMPS